ncbi:MAG: UDP-N-acetylmuramoylalanine--D-glutamate ligase [Candidatus Saccharibacteria bacterium]|nr:UDP-N-acetylmuramoylalanine--D-glutamate ligase [Candidatus Saccharibacteria bacterium]
MNVAILGFDTEGRSSYDFYKARGDSLTILDQNPAAAVPEGAASVLGEHYLQDLDRFDLIVRTAGLPPQRIFEANPSLAPGKVTSQVNQFFESSPTAHIIGVTGTKGKGTTSTLIARMLTAAGFDAQLAGNIGVPALELLPTLTADSWVVLELSSFQLSDFRGRPPLAVCLMVVPEHLNWHADFLDYTSAKAQLFAFQTPEDTAIYFPGSDASKAIAGSGHARLIPFFEAPGAVVVEGVITIDGQSICRTDELKLLGAHNWQNACAAVTAAWQVTQNVEALRSVLTSFSGLEHRLEFVATVAGARYYDDSFGTTPETAIVALQAFSEPKLIILGGADKGASYAELAQTVKDNNVRLALLIGDQASAIQAALEAVDFHNFMPGGHSMDEIVTNAAARTQPGDVVLLSTACASFGMFHDYKDRGQQFTKAVQALAAAAGSAPTLAA